MRSFFISSVFLAAVGCFAIPLLEATAPNGTVAAAPGGLVTFPAAGAKDVNIDTTLKITFPSAPSIGKTGLIEIFEVGTDKLVDTLDMKKPSSPNPSGRAPGSASGATRSPPPAGPNDNELYQTTFVGGIDFHFFPVIVNGNVATLYPHNNKLAYGKSYYVKVAPEALSVAGGRFPGFTTNSAWTFSTKAAAPAPGTAKVTVAADGSADFTTLQGAVDWAPEKSAQKIHIHLMNGNYTELVYINKDNLVIKGESRDKTIVGYPNNSAFNPSKGRGPSRRVAFSVYSDGVQLSSFTINNYFIGQAEGLLIQGERNIVDHMDINGSGDAFTTRGSIYFADSKLTGHGDTVLGYAAVFFVRSEIECMGPFTWTRTPQGSHGNIFVNSTFTALNEPLPWSVTEGNPRGQIPKAVFSRLPQNGRGATANFPYAEMVLINCKTKGVAPEGWGPIASNGFDTSNVHFWEYNTMDMAGKAVDTSRRTPVSKQLNAQTDAKTIADYSNPEFVLGFKPEIL
ncbi:carbohydrate esterase family 8 protein [Aulographum hederae CBS 113979]|uniref:pectinesterase n=1 Tax=Aulographum hederae CBS 113979 TaxID=1176131 RepID=A0A6G1HGP0_9PEZI|nr:carbohydrate esterase family 8 protein [Aulographum hederae CBS 113979]